jgi:hypothetical protein
MIFRLEYNRSQSSNKYATSVAIANTGIPEVYIEPS